MTTSTFSWMHFDADEAKRAQELVKALSEPTTLDSIGIGAIRDGFADILFPGTSTLHTRAIYLLLIPWAIQSVTARKPRSNSQYDKLLRHVETGTITALTKGNPASTSGIIGRSAGKRLIRRPSEAYWSALGTWGIRSSLAGRQLSRTEVRDLIVGKQEEAKRLWSELPASPSGFPNEPLPILPNPHQARFILDRFAETSSPSLTGRRSSLLAYLASHPELSTRSSLWDLEPEDEYIRTTMTSAEGFATVIQGARLRYLDLLFDDRDKRLPDDPVGGRDTLRELIDEWLQRMEDDKGRLDTWIDDLPHMFDRLAASGARVSPASRIFTSTWCIAAVKDPHAAMSSDNLAAMIRQRENDLKGSSARLTHRSPLSTWTGQLLGADYLDFRWGVAKRLVLDCHEGLEAANA